ncbi:putative Multiprotein-bridging factor [Quillaja saponaria]|uniref:Multiprotein-bridging factor n=1 Tax=Quillaja saponaria TaxID=32244 RepID=A0AAD7VN00_QUISA|nr:putative Multiprotein-bridging factor [Quillaja saponaria]
MKAAAASKAAAATAEVAASAAKDAAKRAANAAKRAVELAADAREATYIADAAKNAAKKATAAADKAAAEARTSTTYHDKVLKKAIIKAREDKKLSKFQLAQMINERGQYIEDYESGKVRLNPKVIQKLEKALGMKLQLNKK